MSNDRDRTAAGSLVWGEGERLKDLRLVIRKPLVGRRLDRYLSGRFGQYSRAFFQRRIRSGEVLVNDRPAKPSHELKMGDVITFALPRAPTFELVAEDIPLDILYEDDYLLAVNKPPGLVVHPARGHWQGTLANALLYHCRHLADAGSPVRPGLVHRLDRDTSGVLLVAKVDPAHAGLGRQFQARTVLKEYRAIVEGVLKFDSDLIAKPIGRHPKDRTRMSIRAEVGRHATSFYEVIERFSDHTYVRVLPRTGRTHQIRVHLRSLGHPVLADHNYAARHALYQSDLAGQPRGDDEQPLIDRQALHAYAVTFRHPVTAKKMTISAPVPEDFRRTLEALRERNAT